MKYPKTFKFGVAKRGKATKFKFPDQRKSRWLIADGEKIFYERLSKNEPKIYPCLWTRKGVEDFLDSGDLKIVPERKKSYEKSRRK